MRSSAHHHTLVAEEEVQHVAVLHPVGLAFRSHPAGLFRPLLAAEADEVVVGDGLGPDEAALEIAVDDAGGLRRRVPSGMVQARASFGPAVK